ncbi:MAG TPA: hypothetical protein DHV37_05810 [Erysipelotrichaceae bacterium]|nr:hypothetical protein [Erysipelotrichaceae bacterium]
MAQYNLGYSAASQADAWTNLKTALNNYSSKLTLTYDEETYIAKAEFKDMSYYVTFRCYPSNDRLYIEITLYDSEDTQIAQFTSSAYVSTLYLDVFEAQGDSLIFGTTDVEGQNMCCFAFIDADTPCIVANNNNDYVLKIAIDDHVCEQTVGDGALYAITDSAIQLVKVYDSVGTAFIEDLYISVVAKAVSKNYDITLATIGERKFYLFYPTHMANPNRWLAVECTDKF